jgi:hypothetical protein
MFRELLDYRINAGVSAKKVRRHWPVRLYVDEQIGGPKFGAWAHNDFGADKSEHRSVALGPSWHDDTKIG